MSFKLCYIWVYKFRNFNKFGVNLSSRIKFDFDSDDLRLTKTEINNIPEHFFGDSISDVTGFIGKNGTGKSNLLELVCKLVKGGKTSIDSDFFIILENEGQYECHYRFREHQEIKFNFPILLKEYKSDIDNLKVIYFSNVFDERTHVFDRKVSDLSANNRYPRHNWPSKTKTSDFVKQLQFVRSDLFEDSEIPMPKKVIVRPKLNMQKFSYLQKGLETDATKSESFILELESFLSDVKSLKSSKQKLYYFLVFTVVNEVLIQIRDFNSENFNLDESIEMHTLRLIEDINQIKLTYKSKLDISKKWKEWCEQIINETYKVYFKDTVKNKRQYRDIENLKTSVNLLDKFDKFIESKKLEISTEGSRNRKIEDYILVFNQSASRLDEDFFNFMDRSTRFKLDWLGLSSGHKAYLNLFSLLRFELKSIKASNVLICIDEGDLYLHPKWQADFFYKLVNLIPKFKSANYQFVLTSHSPFLVSDLPKQNLVFLGGDSEHHSARVINNDEIKTFGGNLGELYIDAFFMEGGLISRFAAGKIQKIVDKINDKKKINDDDKKVIDLIGEDLISVQIKNLLNDSNR